MQVKERVLCPPGCRLVVAELCPGTRRNPEAWRTWAGLSALDALLLAAWVGEVGEKLEELHTDIKVGLIPKDGLAVGRASGPEIAEALYSLRIDACVLLDGCWRVVEVKPDAGYVALGQILTYAFYCRRTCACLAECVPCVVTDFVQEAVRPVFESFGVEVEEVGERMG